MSLNELKDTTGKIAEVPLGLADSEQQVRILTADGGCGCSGCRVRMLNGCCCLM